MIGIISDTHDNLEAIDKAVELLNSSKVSLVIHAGDYVAPFTVPRFGKLTSPLKGVFGNNDGEKRGLANKFSEIGVEIRDFLEFEQDGLRICVYHGTLSEVVDALIKSRKYDVIVSGHSHKPEVKKVGGVWSVNPGEVCGYLTGRRTLCLLKYDEPEIIEF
ncbi:MAG: metallophosphoesterase [Candidatus Hydrothermarchaeales archaeon]